MSTITVGPPTFGEANFAEAQLGDIRRTRRLVSLADALRRHPGGSLPNKLPSPRNLKALYRLCSRREVTHHTVLAPHRARTQRLWVDHDTVLILHDSTELDYSKRKSLGDLGDIGGPGRIRRDMVQPATELAVAGSVLQRLTCAGRAYRSAIGRGCKALCRSQSHFRKPSTFVAGPIRLTTFRYSDSRLRNVHVFHGLPVKGVVNVFSAMVNVRIGPEDVESGAIFATEIVESPQRCATTGSGEPSIIST